MLSFLFHITASTAVDNTESMGSPGRKSRRLLPRILKDHVTSLSKGLGSPYDPLKDFVSDLPGNVEGPLHPACTEESQSKLHLWG